MYHPNLRSDHILYRIRMRRLFQDTHPVPAVSGHVGGGGGGEETVVDPGVYDMHRSVRPTCQFGRDLPQASRANRCRLASLDRCLDRGGLPRSVLILIPTALLPPPPWLDVGRRTLIVLIDGWETVHRRPRSTLRSPR